MKQKKNKKRFTKVERFLYKSFVGMTLFLIVGTVFGQTALSKINLEVQKLEDKVNEQADVNESLAMKINEMASYENIKVISDQMGLAYNNDNIKTISE